MSPSSVSTTESRSFSRYSAASSAMSSGIGPGSPSLPPSGLVYAHMCSTSTTPVRSCSDPIGMCTATQCGDSWELSWSSVRKKSARSRSSMLTNTTRARPRSSASLQARDVPTSTPMTADTVTRAPSTTRAAVRSSPWKLGSPGTSIRFSFRSCQVACASDMAIESCRACSSSSESDTVVPASTVPRRFTAPDWKSSASTSDVFPVPRWPTTATLRIFAGSGMGWLSSSVPVSRGKLSQRPEAPGPLRIGRARVHGRTGMREGRARAATVTSRRARAVRRRGAPSGGGSPSCAAEIPATR